MRTPGLITAAAIIVLTGGLWAAKPASACLSFDFNAEVTALDQALAKTAPGSSEAAEIRRLREQAIAAERQAEHLMDEARALTSARDDAIYRALEKLGLKPIIFPAAAPADETPGADSERPLSAPIDSVPALACF
jgi:hypothetical protein